MIDGQMIFFIPDYCQLITNMASRNQYQRTSTRSSHSICVFCILPGGTDRSPLIWGPGRGPKGIEVESAGGWRYYVLHSFFSMLPSF